MSDVFIEVDGFSRPIQELSVEWSLKQRATADVTLIDNGSLYAMNVGQRVVIGDSLNNLFGGTIDELTISWSPGSPDRKWHLRCVSFEQITSRIIISHSFPAGTLAGDMVRSIISTWLAPDGITDTGVIDGPALAAVEFSFATAEEALDTIARLAGYYWDIQPDYSLRFFGRTTFSAPWNISAASANVRRIGALEAVFNRQNVANVVNVRMGQFIGELTSETVTGDGVAVEFETTIAIAREPVIALNGSAQTVGVSGVDTGKDWYWQQGTRSIQQDSGGVVLTGGDSLQIDYFPLYSDIFATVQDAANIASRALVELSSGRYETVIESSTLSTRADGLALGQAYLDANKDDAVSLAISTLDPGLRIGQVINANLPFIGLGGSGSGVNMLIESLTLTARVGAVDNYRAQCSNGPLLPTWQQTFGGSGSGSFSLTAGLQSSGGSGSGSTLTEMEVMLVANTTIDASVVATAGAQLMLAVQQNAATPYTATLGTGFAATGADLGITATLSKWHMFPFFGRADGLWWPAGVPAMEAA